MKKCMSFGVYFLLLLCGSTNLHCQVAAEPVPVANNQMAPPPMSPEELAKWEAEVNKEIDAFVNTLSPEEQQQFHKDVDELTKVMSEMSPDELVKFIETIFPEEGQPPVVPTEPLPTPPTEEIVPVPAPAKVAEPEAPIKAVESARNLIEDILMYSERFLRKTQMIPELSGDITTWVEQQKLKEWKADTSWETLKNNIETFNSILHVLNSKDPKTQKPKFISYVTQDETLNNNLTHVRDILQKFEPKVEPPAFGLGKVSAASRKALQEVLAIFAEAFYKLNLPKELEKILQKYEPRAKELLAEQEAAQKQAFEESKKPRVEAPRKEAGVYAMPYSGGGRAGSEADLYQTGQSPYVPAYYAPDTDYTDEYARPSRERETKPETPTPSEAAMKEEKEKEKEKKEKEKTETSVVSDNLTKRSLNRIEKNLEELASLIEDSQLRSIQEHMSDNDPVNEDLARLQLPSAVRKLKNNITDQIKALKVSLKNQPQQEKAVLQELNAIIAEHKQLLNNLYAQLGGIRNTAGLPADKLKAYKKSIDDLYEAFNSFYTEAGIQDRPAPLPPIAPKPATDMKEKTDVAAKRGAPAPLEAPAELPGVKEVAAKEGAGGVPREAQRLITRIDNYLEQADRAIIENDHLSHIHDHVREVGTVADPVIVAAIKKATQELNSALRSVELFNHNIGAYMPTEQKQAIAQLKASYQEHAKIFSDAEQQLQMAVKEEASSAPTGVTIDRAYAYFGKDLDDATLVGAGASPATIKAFHDFRAVVPTPASIPNLINSLQAVKKAIEAM